jgi:DNA polymerase-3 subunit delta'
MTWNEVVGHEVITERFRHGVRAGKLASTFLFVGPAGIGKRTFAMNLAQALLCETNSEMDLDACGHCPACQQVKAESHPDLTIVSKPSDKNFIPLELLIGDDEHRMREGLCHDISLKPYRGGRKVAVIDDADYLNQEGANCLLKTLEEPPPKSLIILIGTSEQRQLPTIRSRAQVVRFRPLSNETVEQLLIRQGLVENEMEAHELAELSDGSLQQAMELSDPVVREFRTRWLTFLSSASRNSFEFAKELSSFVEAAGKDAPPRRARMKQVARWGAEFYRRLMARLEGHSDAADPALNQALTSAARWFPSSDVAANCFDRCLDAHAQIEANANQATLLECWLDDLAIAVSR